MTTRTWHLPILALLTVAAVMAWDLSGLRVQAQAPAAAGLVYGAGDSRQGQLQTSATTTTRQLTGPVGQPWDDVVSAAIGPNHSLVLRADGTVWGQGLGSSGQLGTAVNASTAQPVQIQGLPSMAAVDAGLAFSLGLDQTGTVWAWGAGADGQLGDGPSDDSATPVAVPGLPEIVQIASGHSHALALGADGTVWSWGVNEQAQLGRLVAGPDRAGQVTVGVSQAQNESVVSISAGATVSLAVTSLGQMFYWGTNAAISPDAQTTPVLLSGMPVARSAAFGGSHLVVADTSGQVWARGWNGAGQLGIGNQSAIQPLTRVPLSGVTKVAAGRSHSLAIRNDGTAWAWGSNNFRELGNPAAASSQPSPIVVTGMPATVRDVDADGGGNSSLWLIDSPTIQASATAPESATCAAPFNALVTLQGYNAVGVTPTDIILVLDESGSIGSQDFQQLKQFATNFVNAQNLGPAANAVGVVMFGTSARTVINLTTNKSSVLNAVNSVSQAGGYTCISCGLQTARQNLTSTIYGRAGAAKLIVVVTDGQHNVTTQAVLAQEIANAQARATVMAIGVGAQISPAQIDLIASDLPGVQTAFLTSDFASLVAIVAELSVDVQPAVRNVIVTMNLGAGLAAAGAPAATAGNISSVDGSVTWSLPQLGAAPVSATIPLVSAGGGGTRPVFGALTFRAFGVPEQGIAIPTVAIVGCPAAVSVSPSTASLLTGQVFNATASVVDDFGVPVGGVPVFVEVTSGPNTGLTRAANTSPAGLAPFSYPSSLPGTDVLSITALGVAAPASAQVTWQLPNTAPKVTAGPPQTISLNGSSTATFALTGTAIDDGQIQPLAIQWIEGATVVSTNPSVTLTRPAGFYTFQLEAFDGELSASATTSVTISDPTAPSITPVVSGLEGSHGWYRGPVSVSWIVTDLESAVTTTGCDAVTFTADGSHSATCTATSAGGTASAPATVTIDQTPPAVTAPGAQTVEATSPAGAIVVYHGEVASDEGSGLASLACLPASGVVFNLGATAVTCTATDHAGNTSTATSTMTVEDTLPPVIDPLADIVVPGTNPAGAAVSWTAMATDLVSGNVPVTCAPASGSVFGYTAMTVTCSATDAAHNSASRTFTVTVTDTTPPVIVPTVAGALGSNGWYVGDVTVSWSVTDPESGVTSSAGCGSSVVSSDGMVSFTCTATSAGGMAEQTVSVNRDATGPVITTSPDLTVGASGSSGAVVTYAAATAVDQVSGVASVSCAPPSGSLFALGTTPVTCTATDVAGNISTAGFTVSVTDTVPPVITSTAPSASSLWPPNRQMVPVLVRVSATDNLPPAPVCSITGVTSNEPQNGLGDGDTPIDWVITAPLSVNLRAERAGGGNGRVYTIAVRCVDAAGNAATSTTTVSVPKSQKK